MSPLTEHQQENIDCVIHRLKADHFQDLTRIDDVEHDRFTGSQHLRIYFRTFMFDAWIRTNGAVVTVSGATLIKADGSLPRTMPVPEDYLIPLI